jgi:hypothetical protein
MTAGGVQAAIADLYRRLAALEAQQAGGEELSANYLTVTPGGLVGADFSGVIRASGVILPAATTSVPTPPNVVAWQRTADGAQVGQVYATTTIPPGPGGQQQLLLDSVAQTVTDSSTTVIAALETSGAAAASLAVSQANEGTTATITANVPGIAVTLLDQLGRSSFLQLAISPTAAAASWGASSLGFTASTISASLAVSHGLPRTPSTILATCTQAPGPSQVMTLNTFSVTPTTFTINGTVPVAYTGNISFYWLAVG